MISFFMVYDRRGHRAFTSDDGISLKYFHKDQEVKRSVSDNPNVNFNSYRYLVQTLRKKYTHGVKIKGMMFDIEAP